MSVLPTNSRRIAWSRRGRWPEIGGTGASHAFLALLVLVVAGADIAWLLRFRRGFPLDIDESGYVQLSFFMHDSLRAGGLYGFWSAFQHEGWGPPLLPATTAVLELAWGAGRVLPAMATQLVFLLVLVVSTYGLARRLGRSPGAGVVAATVVATAPAVVDFTRTYHMVLPSTAMLTLSLYLLLHSERLRRRGWAVAWGVAAGLTLLARTMMVAFVPALFVGAIGMLAVDRADRRRVVNLGLATLATIATGAIWYATSWRPIFSYLTDAGYGNASSQYGPAVSPGSSHYWARELEVLINTGLYLPLALVLVAATAVAAVGAAGRLGPGRVPPAALLRRAVASDAAVPVFVLLEAYLALTSTRNQGTGFTVPLLPPLVVLVVAALFRLARPAPRLAVAVLMLAVAFADLAMKADVVSTLSEPRRTSVPLLGSTQVTNGAGYLQQNLAANAGYRLGPPTHWLSDRDKGWGRLYDTLSVDIRRLASPDAPVRLAPDEPLLNASALRLATYRRYREGGDIGYVTAGADTVAAYRAFLAAGKPRLVVTVDRSIRQYGPPVTPATVAAALRLGRYQPRVRLGTPDERALTLWVRRP